MKKIRIETEEVDYLDRLINDDDYIDSYGKDVLNRIKKILIKRGR
tara:strand:- start:451 stop:585 length:135 start_codon:yes stop_codon:yes gene_type:complete